MFNLNHFIMSAPTRQQEESYKLLLHYQQIIKSKSKAEAATLQNIIDCIIRKFKKFV